MMASNVFLIDKAVKTINSCKTQEQLAVAGRFCKRVIRNYPADPQANDIRGQIIAGLKAMRFEKELKDLINERRTALETK